MNVKGFAFDDESLDALFAALSPERMATYIAAAGGERERALCELLSNLVCGRAASGGVLDLAFAVDEAHAADDLGEPPRPVEAAPALLRALAQPEHHRQRRLA